MTFDPIEPSEQIRTITHRMYDGVVPDAINQHPNAGEATVLDILTHHNHGLKVGYNPVEEWEYSSDQLLTTNDAYIIQQNAFGGLIDEHLQDVLGVSDADMTAASRAMDLYASAHNVSSSYVMTHVIPRSTVTDHPSVD